jgi:5-methyltetrahydropteroyltriglutamate--homocysteine methyltransferase
LKRTVIGSLPRLSEDLDQAIEAALKLQLKHGIHILSDGEQRYNMIQYFNQIPGLGSTPRGLRVTGKIKPMKNPYDSYKIRDYLKARELLRKLRATDKEVKVAVTGPVTLGVSCAVAGVSGYRGPLDEGLYEDLIEALAPLASIPLAEGAWLQVDEPGVSAGFQNPGKSVQYLNELARRLEVSNADKARLTVHICGDLTKIPGLKDELTRLEVKNLSLAFSGPLEEKNINLPLKRVLEPHGKKLGVGCVSVTPRSVEEVDAVEAVKSRVEALIRKVGAEKIVFLHPDCGMRNTPIQVAEEILSRMEKATKPFVQEE